MRVGQAGEDLFNRCEVLSSQMNLTQRQHAVRRHIVSRKRLIPIPFKGGGVAFVLGNDAEENGTAVGVLFIAQRADSTIVIAARFRNARACGQFPFRSGKRCPGRKKFRRRKVR